VGVLYFVRFGAELVGGLDTVMWLVDVLLSLRVCVYFVGFTLFGFGDYCLLLVTVWWWVVGVVFRCFGRIVL